MRTQNGFFSGYSLRNVPLKFDGGAPRRDARRQMVGHSSLSSSTSSSSSSSSKSSEITFKWTGCVWDTSSSDSHSGQLRISPSSTSSSSTSISAEHSGQRITAPPSVLSFAKWGYEDRARHYAAYYIPRRVKSTPVRGGTALNVIASWAEGPFE